MIDKQKVNEQALEHKANRYTKRLDAYQHLLIMLYSVLGQFNSLRELEFGFYSSAIRMNHFGLDYMVRRSTLSDANARRTPAFFEAVYNFLYSRYSSVLADTRPVKGLNKPLFIMDSTTISLFSQVFKGTGRNAINGQKKGGAKAHTVIKADEDAMTFMNVTDATVSDQSMLKGLYEKLPAHSCITFDMGYVNYKAWQEFSDHDITYVTREKKKCKYKVLETRAVPDEDKDAIISDEVVELSWHRRWQRPMTKEELSHRRGRRTANGVVLAKESESGKHKCRRITKWKDNKDEGTITFITNDMENAASTICEVYRRRWQIETLYRRLKQNFPLKYFLGDNQNAIRIQIWVSMIAWLLMQVIKKQVKRKWSLSNLMTAVHILVNSYIGLYDFLKVPEAQWGRVVERRRKIPNESWANTLFEDMMKPNLENQKSITHLQQVTEGEL